MHELGVSREILAAVLKAAQKEQAKRVSKVYLKVGDFTTFSPESIRFYFENLSKDTPAEHAELLIERVPLLLFCEGCETEFTPQDFPPLFICPQCQKGRVKILKGKELEIEAIDVD